ncbi:MAG: hypothetical protein WCL61_03405, partial [bacterium]
MRSEYIADGVKQSSEMTSNIKAGEKQELLMNYKEASFTASSTAELQFELTLDETASVVMATTTNLATSVVSGQAMLVNTLALPQLLSTSSDGALINSVIELESSGDNNEKLAWLMSSIDHWR